MLFAAMIEARSCERFKVLTENIKDDELREFYKELMISEANHYTTFISFARQLGDPEKSKQTLGRMVTIRRRNHKILRK